MLYLIPWMIAFVLLGNVTGKAMLQGQTATAVEIGLAMVLLIVAMVIKMYERDRY